MSKYIYFMTIFIIYCSLLSLASCYLTKSDKHFIKSMINSTKDEKSGIYSTDDKINFMAIDSLLILKEDVERKKICRELDLSSDEPNLFKLLINDRLSCGTQFNYEKEVNSEINYSVSFELLSEKINYLLRINKQVDFKAILEHIAEFQTKNKLYSNYKGSIVSSLKETFIVVEILNTIMTKDENLKNSCVELLQLLYPEVEILFQNLSNEVGIFSESNIDNFELNTYATKALSYIINIVSDQSVINSINKILLNIRNYFIEYKYNYTNIKNIHNLLIAFSNLNNWPIITFDKNSLFFEEENEITVNVKDLFGNDDSRFNITLTYISTNTESVEKIKEVVISDDDLADLPDEEPVKKEIGNTQKTIFFDSAQAKINLDNIKSVGLYNYNLKIESKNKLNSNEYSADQTLQIKALTKVKVNFIQYSIKNQDKTENTNEIKIEYPKRSFKSLKATQTSVIKLKVKLNSEGNQRPEQFFLRLKHNEINKVATVMATKYDEKTGFHIITFDLSDHVRFTYNIILAFYRSL